MPNPDDKPDTARLIDDLVELTRSWVYRGFSTSDMLAALTWAALTACDGSGLSREDMIELVDHHFGVAPPARPTVQA